MRKPAKSNLMATIILMGFGTLLVRFLFSLNPHITEIIYSRGIFLIIRFCLDYTVVLLPAPTIYFLFAFLILAAIKKIFNFIKEKKIKTKRKISFKILFIKGLLYCFTLLGAMIFLFYFLWGFNYMRLPIETHLKIKPTPLNINEIRRETAFALQMVVHSRETIPGINNISNNALDKGFLPEGLEDKIRENLERILKSMNYPIIGRVQVKKIWSGGLLMRLGISGFYLPFTGEAYMPTSLTAVEIPFLLAHEMVHGYGFSREGTANFLAYLACISSREPFIKYSGSLVYFNHISACLYRTSLDEYKELRKMLPPGIIADQEKKYKNWRKYHGWLMDWSQKMYDNFLKTQGIRQGIKSYDRLVILTAAWRKAVLHTFYNNL
jgi:hypothetical protein